MKPQTINDYCDQCGRPNNIRCQNSKTDTWTCFDCLTDEQMDDYDADGIRYDKLFKRYSDLDRDYHRLCKKHEKLLNDLRVITRGK